MIRCPLIAVSLTLLSTVTLFAAQSPQQAPAHTMAAPTNLQVLPKDISHEQLHSIMEEWTEAVGGKCSTCHAEDPKNLAPNGHPRLNFADDSKDEKVSARIMYQMTQSINQQYMSKIDNSGAPVTCSTCHRGHLGPQPFNPDEEKKPAPAAAPPAH